MRQGTIKKNINTQPLLWNVTKSYKITNYRIRNDLFCYKRLNVLGRYGGKVPKNEIKIKWNEIKVPNLLLLNNTGLYPSWYQPTDFLSTQESSNR